MSSPGNTRQTWPEVVSEAAENWHNVGRMVKDRTNWIGKKKTST